MSFSLFNGVQKKTNKYASNQQLQDSDKQNYEFNFDLNFSDLFHQNELNQNMKQNQGIYNNDILQHNISNKNQQQKLEQIQKNEITQFRLNQINETQKNIEDIGKQQIFLNDYNQDENVLEKKYNKEELFENLNKFSQKKSQNIDFLNFENPEINQNSQNITIKNDKQFNLSLKNSEIFDDIFFTNETSLQSTDNSQKQSQIFNLTQQKQQSTENFLYDDIYNNTNNSQDQFSTKELALNFSPLNINSIKTPQKNIQLNKEEVQFSTQFSFSNHLSLTSPKQKRLIQEKQENSETCIKKLQQSDSPALFQFQNLKSNNNNFKLFEQQKLQNTNKNSTYNMFQIYPDKKKKKISSFFNQIMKKPYNPQNSIFNLNEYN
ncbi:hypothetical protein PPERSA_12547 [Pseudocohnilembus persalinus]|uniref:Uncharacterized protein n=1 Tax=Pseudocohnilembus persalinus TaxID=266149 RepID=A0A0V0Q8C2_PSEPJ|nr:hypothetical protein PPERSA_12547 [Pseudocohnilembus persalinus]|eukprot:KRW98438.1 hypothetical protein PPERSA_12547 [Pseudocohnilembus persalinus]